MTGCGTNTREVLVLLDVKHSWQFQRLSTLTYGDRVMLSCVSYFSCCSFTIATLWHKDVLLNPYRIRCDLCMFNVEEDVTRDGLNV